MEEFKAYPKIENIAKLHMTITQKIHGSNGCILISSVGYGSGFTILAGSRTRWLTTDNDNYGFCNWVDLNKDKLIEKLGVGRHFGEWCGKGINNGEGLSDKMFVLFDWWNYSDYEYHPYLMQSVRTVPVLYKGKFCEQAIDDTMQQLKENGSYLTPPGWFMKPEGIVIDINGKKFKKVFNEEEVKWKKPDVTREHRISSFDASAYLQPIRLEKLLSREEFYTRNYPESLPEIVKAYIQDLADEQQITGTDEEIENVRKLMARHVFNFVKDKFNE